MIVPKKANFSDKKSLKKRYRTKQVAQKNTKIVANQ